MSKKPESDFLSGLRVLKEEHAVIRPTELAPPRVPPATDAEAPGRVTAIRQKGREGKVSITQWVDPLVRKQVAQIALDQDKDQYELINEALNLLFEKYGRSPIA
ncbi:MAG: ribbon-helix-helix domain-containing protein [Rhodopila sp.]